MTKKDTFIIVLATILLSVTIWWFYFKQRDFPVIENPNGIPGIATPTPRPAVSPVSDPCETNGFPCKG